MPFDVPIPTIPGYVACPRTDWGLKTIERLDPVLVELIRSGILHEIIKPYVPRGMAQKYKADFEELIEAPARVLQP
ncbi:hypothetical protein [Desulfocurvus sp. DL9XJH121]